MLYIHRNKDGKIESISQVKDNDHQESIASEHDEITSFLNDNNVPLKPLTELAESDTAFIRVLEDVIEILINKDIVQFTDLPSAAQSKLLGRKEIRQRLISSLSTSSTLLDDHNDALI